jgi:hypothetical protein
MNIFTLQIAFLISITAAMAIAHIRRQRDELRQLEILHRGELGHGRVVTIQRPWAMDRCTRLYFEFAPAGTAEPLLCCHVHRPSDEVASLPVEGTLVSVRYLPDRPQRAAINKLLAHLQMD